MLNYIYLWNAEKSPPNILPHGKLPPPRSDKTPSHGKVGDYKYNYTACIHKWLQEKSPPENPPPPSPPGKKCFPGGIIFIVNASTECSSIFINKISFIIITSIAA